MLSLARLFRRRHPETRPQAPAGERIYAVGDVHGRADLLGELLARIQADAAEPTVRRRLVFLGDYIDRGPASRAVLERLATLEMPGFEPAFLKGNHDQAMLDFLDDPERGKPWLSFGGDATLLSYGVGLGSGVGGERLRAMRDALLAAVPRHHLDFLRGLRTVETAGTYAFVHAGVRPGVALERQSEPDLLWIRDEFLGSRRDHGHIVVHGHTVTGEPEVRPNRIGIDTGAFQSGVLTCLVLEDESHRFIRT